MHLKNLMIAVAFLSQVACYDGVWNDPYPDLDKDDKTLYSSYSEGPKHLDPARSYSSNEWSIIGQIYEPPLQYNYFSRPYELEPLTASNLPKLEYIREKGQEYSIYTIDIQPGIYFQEHPAFAKEGSKYLYHDLDYKTAVNLDNPYVLPVLGTRVMTAEDYVYQIKRIANPKLSSPIYGFISNYIVGLKELRNFLENEPDIELRAVEFAGAWSTSKYQYKVKIRGRYPQFQYWLAMPFFAPIAWEVDVFYQQDGLEEHNVSLNTYPVGTGPFKLSLNDPSWRIVLDRSLKFRKIYYPKVPKEHIENSKFEKFEGHRLPLLDKIIFSLEKESIPYWNKFLQGYYDSSGISSDIFNNAIAVSGGEMSLSPELEKKGIRLITNVAPTTMYWGFNMLDPVVGGYTADKRALRQAITLAIDVEEYIAIFLNQRGEVAQHPVPPILMHKNIPNKLFATENRLLKAKRLMIQAGYPGGRNSETGEQLQLFFEAIGSGDPNEKSVLAWLRKQFSKIGIDLVIRSTDYNRFQDKMRSGNSQIYYWGWNADYADPENFLFMFYSKNAKAKTGGENASNYQNPDFDQLFEKLAKPITPFEKERAVESMIKLLQDDCPWVWGVHPHQYSLLHSWYGPLKPNVISRNNLKYVDIDVQTRKKLQQSWNVPDLKYLLLLILGLVGMFVLVCVYSVYRMQKKAKRK